MFTAEQIRNKVYIPDVECVTLKTIEQRIMLADIQQINSIKIRSDNLQYAQRCTLEDSGYNLREVSFLGVNYLEISW
jgi:hypothetical protein